MGELRHKVRTTSHALVVVLLTAAGLAASSVIMRPVTFGERFLTFALGVLLAFMMLLAIERFNAEAATEEVIHADAARLAEDIPPPPSTDQWRQTVRERERPDAPVKRIG